MSLRKIEILSQFVSERRHFLIQRVVSKRLKSIHLCLESPADIHNALACVRTAEALGIYHIHIIAPEGKSKTGKSILQGTKKWVKLSYYDSVHQFLEGVKGYKLYGGVVDASISMEALNIEDKVVLIFGNEHRGLSPEMKEVCDAVFSIPQLGMVESLNLSVAASVTMFDVAKRRRSYLGSDTDLTAEEALKLKADYLEKTVGVSQSEKILNRLL